MIAEWRTAASRCAWQATQVRTPGMAARRKALPGVRLCVACQKALDHEQANFSGYNRRGSKDSQLR